MNNELGIMNLKKLKTNKGFTVIELLVSMTLFLIVIGAVSGVFIQSLRAQRITAALITVNNNSSLAIEQIVREIRTGFNFCPTSGTDVCSDSKLVFTNAFNEKIIYSLVNNSIERSVNGFSEVITAEDINIKKLAFKWRGNSSGDGHPFITMAVGVGGKNPILESAGIQTNIQASVSPRIPE
jgi:prepilin-type N-terminal cleavage/methylation domain-containing protein